jgi:hypothetical protein
VLISVLIAEPGYLGDGILALEESLAEEGQRCLRGLPSARHMTVGRILEQDRNR